MKLTLDSSELEGRCGLDTGIFPFARHVSEILRKMDDEAITKINGYHAGLCDYGGHCGIKTKKYEVPIYRALANHLNGVGFRTLPDQPYPYDLPLECDLYTELPEGERIWTEVKEAWKCWFSNRTRSIQDGGFYRSYLLGQGAGGPLPRTHSAAQDLKKLAKIYRAEGNYVALLILGLESKDDPVEAEIDEMMRYHQLGSKGWTAQALNTIPDRNAPMCQITPWLLWGKTDAR